MGVGLFTSEQVGNRISVVFFNYLSHKELKFLTQLVTPRVRDSSNRSMPLQKERVEYDREVSSHNIGRF